jgi:hypothetical protein
MTAFRERGEPAPSRWAAHPHRIFILRRVAQRDDITAPELAGDLQAASGVKADPSLSRWLIRNGVSLKKTFGPANAIGPMYVRSARYGRLNGSPRCGWSRIARSSSTRREPTRKWHADAARRAHVFAPKAPFGPLGNPDLRRRPSLRRPDRAVGHRRADGPRDLRDLRANAARPHPRKGRQRHPRQLAPPTRAPPPDSETKAPGS